MRVGYIRVSSHGQNDERQLQGLELDKEFREQASGKTAKRPQLEAAVAYLREGDTLFVHSLDRLARNTKDLLNIVHELTDKGVTVTFVKNNLTFTGNDDAMSKLMLALLGAVAEFERSMIVERVKEGITIAKEKGKYKGRKPSLTPEQVLEVKQGMERGVSPSRLAKDYGVHRSTIYGYAKG